MGGIVVGRVRHCVASKVCADVVSLIILHHSTMFKKVTRSHLTVDENLFFIIFDIAKIGLFFSY